MDSGELALIRTHRAHIRLRRTLVRLSASGGNLAPATTSLTDTVGLFYFLPISHPMYTVYVLHSEKFDRLYIGFTSDLENRMLAHNHMAKKGFTSKFRPWKLIYIEKFSSQIQTMKRKKALKSCRGSLRIQYNS